MVYNSKTASCRVKQRVYWNSWVVVTCDSKMAVHTVKQWNFELSHVNGVPFTRLWHFSVHGHCGVIRCTCPKMASSLKTAVHRAKQKETWDLWVVVIYIYEVVWPFSVQCHFGVIQCTCLKLSYNPAMAAPEWNLGYRGGCSMNMGYLWPFSHFGVIQCTGL